MASTSAQIRMIAGTPIHVAEHGEGPRVLLIHGSAQGSRIGGEKHFATQASLANRGWKIVTPDRPGHGLSPAPARGDDASEDSVWAVDLLDDGGHLVGHSFGGAVALATAVRRPNAVRSLTLIEPALQKVGTDIPAVRKFLVRMVAIMLFSFSRESRIKRFARLVGIPDSIRGGSSKAEYRKMGEGLARLKLPSKLEIQQQLEAVRASGIPFTVVTGGWNAAFDAIGARTAVLGGGRHIVIPSPHHFPQNVNEKFNDLLDELMRAAEKR